MWTVPPTTAKAPSLLLEAPWVPPQPFRTPGSSPRKRGSSESGGGGSAPHTHQQLPAADAGGTGRGISRDGGRPEDEARGHGARGHGGTGATGREPQVHTELAAVNAGGREGRKEGMGGSVRSEGAGGRQGGRERPWGRRSPCRPRKVPELPVSRPVDSGGTPGKWR